MAMSDFDAVQIAEGFGDGSDASPERQQEAWQHLIDTGLCWRLQGWFGRRADELIREGVCEPRKQFRTSRSG